MDYKKYEIVKDENFDTLVDEINYYIKRKKLTVFIVIDNENTNEITVQVDKPVEYLPQFDMFNIEYTLSLEFFSFVQKITKEEEEGQITFNFYFKPQQENED